MVDPSFWKGKKVFLTGNTGFKGSWLSIWLHDLGAHVLGYALEPNTTPSLFKLAQIESLVDYVIGDIRDLQYLKSTMIEFDPDIVIHMAAQPLVRESYENPVETYATNVMGTVNVLESVRHCKSTKAVLNITTDKVYENKEWVWGYRESDRLGGYDPYSNSKACSELVTSSYQQSFFNEENYGQHGIAIATARAGNVIGGGDWAKDRLIPDIVKAIRNNEDIILRNPLSIRPWQHVLDPLSGYLELCEKLYTEGFMYNGAWNFGPISDFKSVKWIAQNTINIFGSSSNIIIRNENENHEASYLELDCSKAIKLLKWKPKLTLEETLYHIFDWNTQYSKGSSILDITRNQIRGYYAK